MDINSHSDFERIVYVFQGGGALGAYQVGVTKALTENHYEPHWLIGTSIGAINASIIAGNPPNKRMEKLNEFWNAITEDPIPAYHFDNELLRRSFNSLSAQKSLIYGDRNFFRPNMNNPLLSYNSTPDQISFYSTEPLRNLLNKVIDFDHINRGHLRLTLGSVEIEHGRTVYFDNHTQTITLDHIMASSALPPGFPAIEIEGKYYWDGGVLSNAPISVLLNEATNVKTLCFLAHLFDSYGLLPKNLDDVLKRHKDIIYSSHFKTHMEVYKIIHGLRYTLSQISNQLPNEIKNNPQLKNIMHLEDKLAAIHFVRLLYQAPNYELSSKDYEFSKLSMQERFETGYQDALRAIEKSPWLESDGEELGIAVHEFYRDFEKLASIQKKD